MPGKAILVFLLISFASCSFALADHRVLMQGNNRLAIVEPDGRISWEMPWGGIHDIHVLKNGNILVQQHMRGVAEIDRQTKQVVWSYDSSKENGNAGQRVEVHAFNYEVFCLHLFDKI